jgi:FdhE protein
MAAIVREPTAPEALRRAHPEWSAWIAIVELARREAMAAAWDACAPERLCIDAGEPGLTGATVEVDAGLARRWVRTLLDAGRRAGADLGTGRPDADAAAALLEAALDGRPERLREQAHRLGGDVRAVQAIAPLAVLPMLHACRRAVPPAARGRHLGRCPLCGAWPALAEARGLERSRQLRCGRCALDWGFDWLRCPFCDNTEHTRLGGLVGEDALDTRRVDTCDACHGYVKTVTALRPTPPEDLALLDLATVDLDVVALQRGYGRPEGPPRPLGARVVTRRASRLPWAR